MFYSRFMYPINMILKATRKHHKWNAVASLLPTIGEIYRGYVQRSNELESVVSLVFKIIRPSEQITEVDLLMALNEVEEFEAY